jgi:hypothetical protein
MRTFLGRLISARRRVQVFQSTLLDAQTHGRHSIKAHKIRLWQAFVSQTVLHKELIFGPTLFRSDNNHAQELRRLQSRSITGSPAPVLRSMPVRLVLFQGLSGKRLEETAQANLQASQCGAWRYAGAATRPYRLTH